ncbi:MAG: hypothetical protein Tsb009_27050 [Planctomycetaceae bacterium]
MVNYEAVLAITIFVVTPIVLLIYRLIIDPFREGMQEGKREIEKRTHRIPENCPVCGEETRLNRELCCIYCGEHLGPEINE